MLLAHVDNLLCLQLHTVGSPHTQYLLLAHADELLCLQLHTVGSAYTVHASNPFWWLAVVTASDSRVSIFCGTSRIFIWFTLLICCFGNEPWREQGRGIIPKQDRKFAYYVTWRVRVTSVAVENNSAVCVVELHVPVNYTKILNVAQSACMANLCRWQQYNVSRS